MSYIKNLLLSTTVMLLITVQASSLDMPIDISSDSMEVRQDENIAVFSGTVEIIHDGLKLGADTLEIFYGNKNSNSDGIEKIVARGNVTFIHKNSTATGNSIVYDPTNAKVIMEGNVSMVNNGNTLKGTKLIYDIKTGHLNMKSAGSRVKAIIAPNVAESHTK